MVADTPPVVIVLIVLVADVVATIFAPIKTRLSLAVAPISFAPPVDVLENVYVEAFAVDMCCLMNVRTATARHSFGVAAIFGTNILMASARLAFNVGSSAASYTA